MNGAAPVQCVNCEWEQPFEQIYCARCGCSLDAAKPLGQTWAGTFLIIGLLFGAALFVGGAGITALWSALDPAAPSLWFGAGMLIAAALCVWAIWRLARR